jgi:putative transposase
MMKSRFSDRPIALTLLQVGQGAPVARVCRKLGISQQTEYPWRKTFGEVAPSEIKKRKQIADERFRRKHLRDWLRGVVRRKPRGRSPGRDPVAPSGLSCQNAQSRRCQKTPLEFGRRRSVESGELPSYALYEIFIRLSRWPIATSAQ